MPRKSWAFPNVGRAGAWDNRERRNDTVRSRASSSGGWWGGCWNWCANIRVTVIDEFGHCCDRRAGV